MIVQTFFKSEGKNVDEIEKNALNFLKKREYEKAANLYLKLALQQPDVERYFITSANCYDQLGDKKTALNLYLKALKINPQSLTALLNLSTLYYELKKYEKTVLYANKALEIDENNFSATLNIANAYYADKDYSEALTYYEKLYSINPNSYNAVANIANTCYNLSQFVRAIEYAKMAIDLRPNTVDAYIIAGNAYAELYKKDDAGTFLKKAAAISPNSEWVCNSISNLYIKMGNYKQGLHYAWRLFFLKNYQVNAQDHINFGYLLYEAHDEKQDDLVKNYIELWKSHFPDDKIVHHLCSALTNTQDIKTSDLTYIKNLFDGFASSFDTILKELNYSVPSAIANSLKSVIKTKLFKKQRFLDIGCGTGLCVESLKPHFPNEEYYGIDISEKMLSIASKKNIYNHLYTDDIFNFLQTNNTQYNAIISGDVLTYIGDLKPLITQLNPHITPNGYFCFSISKNVYNNNEYHLTPSGRFVHSISYIMRQLKHCGFDVIKTEEIILRKEGHKDVLGYIVLAKKSVEIVFK